MRFLGLVRSHITRDTLVRQFLLSTMIARVIHRDMRRKMRAVCVAHVEEYLRIAADYFNLVLGASPRSSEVNFIAEQIISSHSLTQL